MRRRDWELEEAALGRISMLFDLWRRYGRVTNLSSDCTEQGLAPHVLDGLDTAWLAKGRWEPGAGWLDVGSGGGFPGLVVAAVLQGPMVLLEPREKRARFLELAVRSIGRANIRVERARLECFTWNKSWFTGSGKAPTRDVGIASARAVWAPDEWLGRGQTLLGSSGWVLVHGAAGQRRNGEAVVDSACGRISIVRVGEEEPLGVPKAP